MEIDGQTQASIVTILAMFVAGMILVMGYKGLKTQPKSDFWITTIISATLVIVIGLSALVTSNAMFDEFDGISEAIPNLITVYDEYIRALEDNTTALEENTRATEALTRTLEKRLEEMNGENDTVQGAT